MQVLFIRKAFCLSTGFGTGPIDHFQFVISCQIKFNFIKICMLPWYFFKAQKGQGLLSQSGSINIYTLRLWLAQQMGTHTPFAFCIYIWLWGQQDLHLWQPWLMHSHQGMEMFLLQSCSALTAMLSQAICPSSPQNIVVSWFHKPPATYRQHWMGEGGSCQWFSVW